MILTPPNTHLELVERCAKAGKHVLLEKPLEISIARAEQLVSIMQSRKPKLGVVLQHRFRPAVEKMRTVDLGQIVSASCVIPVGARSRATTTSPAAGRRRVMAAASFSRRASTHWTCSSPSFPK